MQLSKSCCKTTLILLGFLPFVLGLDVHGAVLYEQYGSQGINTEITGYAPDLSKLGFDNRARSACILGVWLFYSEPGYKYGDMHWAQSGDSTNPHCLDLESNAGSVSSVRFSGSTIGVNVNTFNLYERDFFMGEEEFITSNRPSINLAGRHASIIITGMGSWTLFEEANYSGPHRCLIPVSTITIITDISNIGIQHGSFRSIIEGCVENPDIVDRLPPAPMSGSSGNFSSISHLENV